MWLCSNILTECAQSDNNYYRYADAIHKCGGIHTEVACAVGKAMEIFGVRHLGETEVRKLSYCAYSPPPRLFMITEYS